MADIGQTGTKIDGLRSGLVSITFRKLDPGEIISLVSQAKLEGIEWGGDVHVPHGDLSVARDVRAGTENAGLTTFSYGSYYRAGESEAQGLAFESVLETAAELGAPTIRVWAGARGSDEADMLYRERVISDVRSIAELAEDAGITISFEFHRGTLTDTNESALALLREVDHPNVRTFWQPPNGADQDYCLSGLRDVRPWLTNIHAFHWWPTSKDRRPLVEGKDRWLWYLSLAATTMKMHPVLLEFVPNDDPDQFLEDARTLREWIDSVGGYHFNTWWDK